MTTTHDITITSEATGVGFTVSMINICPPVIPRRLPCRQTTSNTPKQPLLRYENPKPHRDTLLCNRTRHYFCTLTTLYGPHSLFVMMYDRTWVDNAHHSDDCVSSNTSSTSHDMDAHVQSWEGRLDSPPPSHTSPTTPTLAHTSLLYDSDGPSSCSGCGHRLCNIQGVQEWHRFRAEMLRQTVEEGCQSLLMDCMVDPYDLSDNVGSRTRLDTQLSQSSRIIQHHYTQRACSSLAPPLRHPNQSSQDEFRHVLQQVDWDAIWSKAPMTGSNTSAIPRDPMWKEGTFLEKNDGPADTLHQPSQSPHHQHSEASRNMIPFDKEHPAVDTLPSSTGIRIKSLQPKRTDPRLKFPTVYEIGFCEKREGEEVKASNEDEGIPLSRHPSGQVKIIRLPISERFLQGRGDTAMSSINDKEEVVETLDDSSSPVVCRQVEETLRYCGFYADLLDDSTPYQDKATLQPVSSSTTPLRQMTPFHSGFTATSSTVSASTPFASFRMRSSKIQPYPMVIHTHPDKNHDQSLWRRPSADSVSRSKCRSLRTKQLSPSSSVNQPIERQNRDRDMSDFLKLHQWARTPRDQQRQQTTEKHVSSYPSSASTTPQNNKVNRPTTMHLDGQGGGLRKSDPRKRISIEEDAALEKEPQQVQQQEQEQCEQRRNGKQLFEAAHCIKTDKSTLADDLLRLQPQEAPTPQIKGGRVAERWKPSLATIPSQPKEASSSSFLSSYPPTTTTTMTPPQGSRKPLPQFAAGHDPRVNSYSCASSIHIPNRTSSLVSIASGPTSPTRSSTGSTIPPRHSSENSTFPSIASILKKPTYPNCNTGGTIDRKMSFPSLLRDPSVPQERSRLVEKGVKFVPDHAPPSVRLDKTIELLRLARLPLQVAATTTTVSRGAAAAPPSPISPADSEYSQTTGSEISQTSVSTCPTTPTTPSSIRSKPSLSPTTAEHDRPSLDYQHPHNTSSRNNNRKRYSYEDIILSAGNATKAFVGHVMQCDEKVKVRVDKASNSLSSSTTVSSSTFQRMRTKIGGRFLGRESIGDEGESAS
ncbi:hypothetical protein BG015_003577 [Linnemannia schmuckeri]|uniref:Uncharacterized protein n=1 Tax=Linnemannia schmuckeri TaxID=64567 RepID=A0A9P5VF32_9FUNG|nr:hypothetical protein BG015_003577 [Linnemannia schmuckeri]